MRSAQSRVQRRGVETRRRLIDSTKSLLATGDYQTITLDQVAAAAGVAKSSVLWHFGSKEGLLTEAVFSLFEEVDARINLEKSHLVTLNDRVQTLLEAVSAYFTNNPEAKGIAISLLLNRQIPDKIRRRVREQWQHHIEEISRFLSTNDVTVDHDTSAALMAQMHGCYLQWHLEGCDDKLSERLSGAVHALSRLLPLEPQ